eukprot:scaffold99339_cov66-Phaeocystis_antarctica.AAC.4
MALRRLLRPNRRYCTQGEQVVLRAALQRKRARLRAGLLCRGLAAPSSAAAADSGRLRGQQVHQETDADCGGRGGRRDWGWRRHVRSGPRPTCCLRLVERGCQRVIIQAVAEIGVFRAADIAADAVTAVNATSRVDGAAATPAITTAYVAAVATRQIAGVAQAAGGACPGSSSSESLTTTRRRIGGWCGCDVRGEGPPPSRGSEVPPPFEWRRATTALVRWSSKSSQSENSSSVRAPSGSALPPPPRAPSPPAHTSGCAPPGVSVICGGSSSSIDEAVSSAPAASAAGSGAIGQSPVSPHTLAPPSQSAPSPQSALSAASDGTRGGGEGGGGGPAPGGPAPVRVRRWLRRTVAEWRREAGREGVDGGRLQARDIVAGWKARDLACELSFGLGIEVARSPERPTRPTAGLLLLVACGLCTGSLSIAAAARVVARGFPVRLPSEEQSAHAADSGVPRWRQPGRRSRERMPLRPLLGGLQARPGAAGLVRLWAQALQVQRHLAFFDALRHPLQPLQRSTPARGQSLYSRTLCLLLRLAHGYGLRVLGRSLSSWGKMYLARAAHLDVSGCKHRTCLLAHLCGHLGDEGGPGRDLVDRVVDDLRAGRCCRLMRGEHTVLGHDLLERRRGEGLEREGAEVLRLGLLGELGGDFRQGQRVVRALLDAHEGTSRRHDRRGVTEPSCDRDAE